jgi:hypothetical protein
MNDALGCAFTPGLQFDNARPSGTNDAAPTGGSCDPNRHEEEGLAPVSVYPVAP